MLLTREQILAIDDLERVEVPIPEWGGAVYVRILTGAERDFVSGCMLDADGTLLPAQERLKHYRARVVALSTCDAQGTALFTLADLEALSRKAGRALDRIVEAAEKLNAMTASEVEQLAKNCAPTPDAASGSA